MRAMMKMMPMLPAKTSFNAIVGNKSSGGTLTPFCEA
jgi:hypothetical protein